jgi:hypothetical protein
MSGVIVDAPMPCQLFELEVEMCRLLDCREFLMLRKAFALKNI